MKLSVLINTVSLVMGNMFIQKKTIAEIKELFEFGLKHLPFPYEIKYII